MKILFKDNKKIDREIVRLMSNNIFNRKNRIHYRKIYEDKFYALMDNFKQTKDKAEFEVLCDIMEGQMYKAVERQTEKIKRLEEKMSRLEDLKNKLPHQ